MPQKKQTYAALCEPYEHKCGKVTFIVSAFGNQDTPATAEDIVMRMLESRAREEVKKL